MNNPTSYTDEQVRDWHLHQLKTLKESWQPHEHHRLCVEAIERSMTDRTRLQVEVDALRKCALKYLAWHHVEDPAAGLERDLRDPKMCGYAAAKYAARATPNETKEAKS